MQKVAHFLRYLPQIKELYLIKNGIKRHYSKLERYQNTKNRVIYISMCQVVKVTQSLKIIQFISNYFNET